LIRQAFAFSLIFGLIGLLHFFFAQNPPQTEKIFPGADEQTPSRAYYFDWISSQYEGSTEAETLIKLDFFKWLHDEYGMKLDIFTLDVGNIDDGPFTAGVGRLIPVHWGTLESDEFKAQFPRGFAPIYKKAKSFGCRLGVWLGPDGFGDTPEEEKARADMMITLCRDFNFHMFKLDAVAGGLREEKQEALSRTLLECRKYSPDLIVNNHRVKLGTALPHATTHLWEGAETYIDVFSNNTQTATHHRAGALSRGLLPGLTRLMEDHGVCISSCLDYWEDDLILQTFNRGLLMAPEIYGSPWLLRDDEFPKFARIFNLQRRFGKILVNGMVLPENKYGPFAVSRGDAGTRLITLRNLTWEPVTYQVDLNSDIGLTTPGKVEVRRFHPSERILGTFDYGDGFEIEVLPFRACLIMVTTEPCEEIGIWGVDYEVIKDLPDQPVEVKLLGLPGSSVEVSLAESRRKFAEATLEGKSLPELLDGKKIKVNFPGKFLTNRWHRKLGALKPAPVPEDAETLYEATCFAADSNALEVRSLLRSGPSEVPQVERARKMFFEKEFFVNRGIWDKNLFDGSLETFFIARLDGRALRVDFGERLQLDRLVIKVRSKYEHDINPAMHAFDEDSLAEVSSDLKTWIPVGSWHGKGTIAIAKIPAGQSFRYVRIHGAPQRIAEVEGYIQGKKLDRSKWRASNLFYSYKDKTGTAAWAGAFKLDEIAGKSYLAIALEGRHGDEGAYAAIRVAGEAVGAPDRAVSFPSNTWEYYNVEVDSNYTYYVPLSEGMSGKNIEVIVLVLEGGKNDFKPEAYLTAYPIPFSSLNLVLR
jgi:hypothetical protein